MEARYGEAYREERQGTWMFLPGEPGGRLQQRVFGWIRNRRARLILIYALSIPGVIGAAFVLRKISIGLTTRVVLPEQKVAAVSFLTGDGGKLRDLLKSAEGTEDIQRQIKGEDGWVLVQAMQGKRAVVHVMIDAGMTRQTAQDLKLVKEGVKLVFSRPQGGSVLEQPFGISVRWHPAFVAEMNDGKVSDVLLIDQNHFVGNPVMPVF